MITFDSIFKPSLSTPVLTVNNLSGLSGTYRAIFKLEYSLGVYYNNLDYNSPNLTSSITASDIALPVDNNGNIVKSSYKITGTFRIENAIGIGAIDQGTKKITVPGTSTIANAILNSYLTDEHGTVTQHKISITSSTGNNGDYTVVSATVNGNNVDIIVSETLGSAVADGYVIYYTYPTPVSYTFDYEFTSPVAKFTVETNCLSSTIKFTDITDKEVPNVTLVAINRFIRIKYPVNREDGTIKADITDSSTTDSYYYIVGAKIATRTWNFYMDLTLNYLTSDGAIISVDLKAEDSTDVECPTCICDLINCKNNVQKEIEDEEHSEFPDSRKITLLKSWTKEFDSYMDGYNDSLRCNDISNASKYLNKMKYISSLKCGCCKDKNQSLSIDVPIAINSGGSSTGGGCCVNFSSGADDPVASMGNNNDIYANTTSGDVFKKIGGTWVKQYNYKESGIKANANVGTGGTVCIADAVSSTLHVLQQAPTAILTQANTQPQTTLRLFE